MTFYDRKLHEPEVKSRSRQEVALPTRERLMEIFTFDWGTGEFFHKRSIGRVKAGQRAGTPSHGYRKIGVDGKIFYQHRLVAVMVYGTVPAQVVVDHISGVTLDSSPLNIRLVSQRQNGFNRQQLNRNNSSGYRGVSFNKARKKFQAYISDMEFHKRHLGFYADPHEAALARAAAEVSYGIAA